MGKSDKKAWVVAVNMGYGHQRTAYPLKDLAFKDRIINANDYEGIPEKDTRVWESSRKFYEFISNFKEIPLIGDAAFFAFDRFQRIMTFYPRRDLSRPTYTLEKIFSFIKKGWGKDLILRLKDNPLPLITTFFTPAFMAETFEYPGDIFCVICDADISRSWVPLNPKKSRIKYFAPNSWVANRLELYGVKKENIFLTGYPLPVENIGSEKMEIVKNDLRHRLLNLDPNGEYCKNYKPLVEKYLGGVPARSNHIFTILFSIGGAGAQKEIAVKFLKSLKKKVRAGKIRLILMAGTKKKIKNYFLEYINKIGLAAYLNRGIEIVFAEDFGAYFQLFNHKLRTADILWTKPSELSFYTGLGLPIIIAPPIGSQEEFNRRWLLRLGSGILQENPNYADEWLFDYLNSGRFAESAMEGFIETEKLGVYNIRKICLGY